MDFYVFKNLITQESTQRKPLKSAIALAGAALDSLAAKYLYAECFNPFRGKLQRFCNLEFTPEFPEDFI